MKHPDGAYRLSYNVQTTTSAETGRFLVGIVATQTEADMGQLMTAVERVQEQEKPLQQLVADGGYVSRDNAAGMQEKKVELVAPWKPPAAREAGALKRAGIDPEYGGSKFKILPPPDATPVNSEVPIESLSKLECPQGKQLEFTGTRHHHGLDKAVYVAQKEDCQSCPAVSACCGQRGSPRRVERTIETEPIKDLVARMEDPARQALYKRRKEVAEWPHLWIKSLKKVARFSVFGQVKVGIELTWMALAYNVEQMVWARKAAVV